MTACGVAAPAFSGSQALAAQTRKLVGTFGSLSSPGGLAIEQSTGDVYVADTGNHRVLKFDALGDQLLGFGADVGGAGVNTCTTLCEPGTAGSAPGQFTTAEFVAIDNSGGPSAGDVYVADVGDNVVSKFDSTGNLVSTWGVGGQLNGSSTTAGSFGSLAGIAVDSAGTLYVWNTEKQLFKFRQDGSFEEELVAGERGVQPSGFGVDGKGNLFRVNGDGSIEELLAGGGDVGAVTPDGSVVPVTNAFAVGPEGALYVATAGETLDHYAFNGAGEVLEPGGSTCAVQPFAGCAPSDSIAIPFVAGGVAFDAGNGDVYVANPAAGAVYVYAPAVIPDVTTEAATEVGPSGATLNGTVNPGGVALSDCHFDYGTSTAYGQSAQCVPAAGSISGEQAVTAHLTGLQPGTAYHFRLVAGNENGSSAGADAAFRTLPLPSIDSATASELTPETVRLNAEINPHGFDTRYRFEYGTSTAYEGHGPEGDAGAGEADVAVSERLERLIAGKTYHWRVVASSANGQAVSPDHTFVYESAGPNLPDDRAYEMVSPPQKNGALLDAVLFAAAPDVAGSGERVVVSSIQCFAGAESCNAKRKDATGSPYEFTRTPQGWAASAMAPPATQLSVASSWGASAEAGAALFSAPVEPFGEDYLYGRRGDGTLLPIGPVTPPEAGALGPAGGDPDENPQAVSADLSHVVWRAKRTGAWPFDHTTGEFRLYEYAGTRNPQPLLVGVSGGAGSIDLLSLCGTTLAGKQDPQGRLSSDGRTVFFMTIGGEGCVGFGSNAGVAAPANEVYARLDNERTDAHTVAISARSPSDCTGACQASSPQDAEFMGASADGSKAFFTSTQQLTNSASQDNQAGDTAEFDGCAATTGENGCNLYLYDFGQPAGHELIDVSAGSVGGGPRVQGVAAVSADGSHVYFVARGVLTSSPNGLGQSAQDGAENLYVFERDAAHPLGQVSFVAPLAASDRPDWTAAGDLASVTPDGRYLVFTSHGQLTADDTSASGAKQVFRYDARSGALVRISVGNNGFNDNGNRSTATPCDSSGCSEDASIVTAGISSVGFASRRDPTMSDDGSYVFFTSAVALTPQALDSVQIGVDATGGPVYAQNVYEWHAGHVYLISDGHDVGGFKGRSAVALLGSDSSGANVFFSTTDQLSSQDTDTELDYYDARICTAADPCLQSSAARERCQGEACQGPPGAQPAAATVASIAFTGQGNVPPGAAGGKVTVLRGHAHSSRFVVTVKVPGGGRIAVAGRGVVTLRRTVTAAGSYRLVVSLTRAARARLRRSHRLNVRLTIGYTPTTGPSSTASLSLTTRR